MKASSVAAVMVGAIAGASAATAFGMVNRQTQRKLKKLVSHAGCKLADGLNSLMG